MYLRLSHLRTATCGMGVLRGGGMDMMDQPGCSVTCHSAWFPAIVDTGVFESFTVARCPEAGGQQAVRAGMPSMCSQVKVQVKSRLQLLVTHHLSFSCGRGRFQSAGGLCLEAHTRVCFCAAWTRACSLSQSDRCTNEILVTYCLTTGSQRPWYCPMVPIPPSSSALF